MIKIEQIRIDNWQHCIEVSNQHLSLIATTDVGPRIISLGLKDQRNLFYQNPEELGLTGGNEWHSFGGHRLWIAPEETSRTYFPDNHPVQMEKQPDGIKLTAQLEENTGFQKHIQFKLAADLPHVELIHTLVNHSPQSQIAAAWALTVMAAGGIAILPHSPREDWPANLTAQNTISLWSYTAMSDPRYQWGDRYILIHQTGGQSTPQKIGMFNSEGWAAYLLDGFLFIKIFPVNNEIEHPDLNSNLEVWTDDKMLELETLGPLVEIESGQSITHREDWFIVGNVGSVSNDEEVDKVVLPHIKKCQSLLSTLE